MFNWFQVNRFKLHRLKALAIAAIAVLSLTLSSCSVGVSGLQSYVDAGSGYEFLYPNGWMKVSVKDAEEGVDVIFRDLIQTSENLSVVISDIARDRDLSQLGSPTDVARRFLSTLNTDPANPRKAELISADRHENQGKTYYTLEYEVEFPDRPTRHNVASIAVSRGKLFTFNVSTAQGRWEKVKTLFDTVVNSFSVY